MNSYAYGRGHDQANTVLLAAAAAAAVGTYGASTTVVDPLRKQRIVCIPVDYPQSPDSQLSNLLCLGNAVTLDRHFLSPGWTCSSRCL